MVAETSSSSSSSSPAAVVSQQQQQAKQQQQLVHLDKLTSDWYTQKQQQYHHSAAEAASSSSSAAAATTTTEPVNGVVIIQDFADVSLLIPHEFLRREMTALVKSVQALPDDIGNDNNNDDDSSWKILYLAEWFVDYFYDAVHFHHDSEEKYFFPWLAERVQLPEKDFSKSHQELLALLDDIKDAFERILKHYNNNNNNSGQRAATKTTTSSESGLLSNAKDIIAVIKEKVPLLERDMREHLLEEERDLPPLLRAHFTESEYDALMQKITKDISFAEIRYAVAGMVDAAQEWMTEQTMKDFRKNLPPLVPHLIDKYYVPDYRYYVTPMRDAPTLASKPNLRRVKCCRIPFCCIPCIM